MKRLTNEHKAYVRAQLAQGLKVLQLDDDTIQQVMSTGSVPLPVDVARRIARMDDYDGKGITLAQVQRGLGEWIAYKAGVRVDAGETEPNEQ